jgi:glycosyltransferase involved in cell wall biosynthesis
MKKFLFITWDGPQTSYLEGLFVPIFDGLKKYGYQPHILQFTWADADSLTRIKNLCTASDIPYRSVPVMRKGGILGGIYTAITGVSNIRRIIFEWNIDTIIFRNLMSATAVLLLGLSPGMRFIFDSDGFPADERVDFRGLSQKSLTYKALRAIERRATSVADRVLVRTPRAIDILVDRAKTCRSKFYIVGNGRDPEPFVCSGWPERTDAEFRLCYAGSLGTQYRPAEMLSIAQNLKAQIPNLVFRIFTGDKAYLKNLLDHSATFDQSWIEVLWVPPSDLPAALMECDLAIALRKLSFSSHGVAPIKLGDYALAGLPVIGTSGVGLVEPLIDAGIMLAVEDDFSTVWPWVRDNVMLNKFKIQRSARNVGLEHFTLKASVESYVCALDF